MCPKNLVLGGLCGSDGKRYGNECVMKCEACKQGKIIIVASEGECPKEQGDGRHLFLKLSYQKWYNDCKLKAVRFDHIFETTIS